MITHSIKLTRDKRNAIIVGLMSAAIFAINMLLGNTTYFPSMLILCLLIIVLSLLTANFYKNNIGAYIAFFFIFYCNYSITVGVYLDVSQRPQFFSQFNDFVFKAGLMGLFTFSVTVFVFSYYNRLKIKKFFENNSEITIYNLNPSDKMVIIICDVATVVLFGMSKIGFDPNSAERFLGQTFGLFTGPIYEYRLIFFAMACTFSKGRYFKTHLAIVMLAFVFTLLTGNRVDAITYSLLFAVSYFNQKFKVRWMFLIIPGMILFLVIGQVRARTSGLFSFDFIEYIKQIKFVSDTATFSYIPSLATVNLSSMLNLSESLAVLKGFFLSVLFGGEYKKYRLEVFTRQYFVHFNGSTIVNYLYLWVREFSGIIIGIVSSIYINIGINSKGTSLGRVMFLYFIATTPRWYLYGFIYLTRGFMWLIIAYIAIVGFCNMFDKTGKVVIS